MNNEKIRQIGEALVDISKWDDTQHKENELARLKFELNHVGDRMNKCKECNRFIEKDAGEICIFCFNKEVQE